MRWKADGTSNREIARRLGVTENAVRKQARRLEWPQSEQTEQMELELDGAHPKLSAPGRSESTESPQQPERGQQINTDNAHPKLSALESDDGKGERLPLSFDMDPTDRSVDRLLARLGLLNDAAPMFSSAARVPGAGVLLALSALVDSGVFDVAREIYGSIGPAFYGLRTTMVALLSMALLRIKKPEGIKEHSPQQLGRILGLDRAPEVKTLRRKLMRLAAYRRAAEFGRALAEQRVATAVTRWAFCMWTGTCGFTTANANYRRRTWHACASRCLPRRTTG